MESAQVSVVIAISEHIIALLYGMKRPEMSYRKKLRYTAPSCPS